MLKRSPKRARAVAERLSSGGRIYAFGRGAYATDAQHVAVEFVHPVLVGKPALPASDLSLSFEVSLPAILAAQDVVVGFGPPAGDPAVTRALAEARALGAFTIALPGRRRRFRDDPGNRRRTRASGDRRDRRPYPLRKRARIPRAPANAMTTSAPRLFSIPFSAANASQSAAICRATSSPRSGRRRPTRKRCASASRPKSATAIAAAVATMAEETLRRRTAAALRKRRFRDRRHGLGIGLRHAGTGIVRRFRRSHLPPSPRRLPPSPTTSAASSSSSRQLIAQVRPHDVVVALSTSGGSLERHHGARRSAQARKHRPSRCSATTAARSCVAGWPTGRSSFDPTTSRASKKRRRRSITRCAARSIGCAMSLELFAARDLSVLLRKCASSWSGTAASTSSTTSKPTRPRAARLIELVGPNAMVPVLVEDGRVGAGRRRAAAVAMSATDKAVDALRRSPSHHGRRARRRLSAVRLSSRSANMASRAGSQRRRRRARRRRGQRRSHSALRRRGARPAAARRARGVLRRRRRRGRRLRRV